MVMTMSKVVVPSSERYHTGLLHLERWAGECMEQAESVCIYRGTYQDRQYFDPGCGNTGDCSIAREYPVDI